MRKRNQRVLTARLRGIISEWFYLRPVASERPAINSGAAPFSVHDAGPDDTGANDKHLISHAKETNKLWQNLVRGDGRGL